MPPSYFELPAASKRDLLGIAASRTGRAQGVIEKDIWLSLVLQHLFAMPGRKAMAFKGGTSLSKVYSVIQRFSEDVDVTIDYRELGCDTPVSELKNLSGRQRTLLGEKLKAEVVRYTHETVQPYLNATLKGVVGEEGCEVTISENGEELHVSYPSQASDRGGYLREFVLVEFGGRNIIEPHGVHTLQPDIVNEFPDIIFPKAEGIVVLAAERTFWEKVTLIHAQCNRPFARGRERISRHWYDLAMLAQHETGQRAVNDLALMADVIDLKNTFYRSGSTCYEQCLAGNLKLVPDSENLATLNEDYAQMQGAGMLNGHEYSMTQIMGVLRALQGKINRLVLDGARVVAITDS